MQGDLISRESLRTKIRQKMFDTRYDFELAMDVIKTIPAVNAKPVVHGEWEANCTCSCCGYFRQMTRSGNYMVGNFCPNCGADMRGDTDGDQ